MFADLAPRLRERGWGSLLPLHNPGKAPIISAWQRFNLAPPTDAQIESWATRYPTAGIGLAVGPDLTAGVDLDFREPAEADRARCIALEHFGPTPLIRVGLPPKSMLLYQHSGDLPASRRLGGVEIFSTTGQFVLNSTHPDTGKPYHWPVESPQDVAPTELPIITPSALAEFILAVSPLCFRPEAARAMATSTTTGNGRTAELLRAFADRPTEDPAAIAAAYVAAAGDGDRHYSTVAAITALASIGLSDAEIRDALIDPYAALFATSELDHRMRVFESAIRWGRKRIGLPLEELTELAAIGEAWQARWKR
jgi:hypothetical protein